MTLISVIIPTYRTGKHIPAILDALLTDYTEKHGNPKFELIIVNNGLNLPQIDCSSIDRYADLYKESDIPFIHIKTSCPGAHNARYVGIQHVNSPLVLFLDDDIIPTKGLLKNIYDFFKAHPQALGIACQISPIYNRQQFTFLNDYTQDQFNEIAPYYAISTRGETPGNYTLKKRVIPPMAAFATYRQTFLNHVPQHLTIPGRIGESQTIAGEDLEAILHILKHHDGQIHYVPDCKVHHILEHSRFTRERMNHHAKAIGLGKHPLRMMNPPFKNKFISVFAFLMSDLRKLIQHFFQDCPQIPTNSVSSFKYHLYFYSALSPFYFFMKNRNLNR